MFTQSNNAAELMAIIKALQRSVSLQPLLQKLVIPHICTDSQYVIQSVLSHIPAWKLSLPPDPHEPNALLIQELGILSRQHTIIWQHVRAHTTADDFFSYYNRVVDKQANKITIDPPAGTPHVRV
jgi:ribonuclease HI